MAHPDRIGEHKAKRMVSIGLCSNAKTRKKGLAVPQLYRKTQPREHGVHGRVHSLVWSVCGEVLAQFACDDGVRDRNANDTCQLECQHASIRLHIYVVLTANFFTMGVVGHPVSPVRVFGLVAVMPFRGDSNIDVETDNARL
jgi:hypothetical protein